MAHKILRRMDICVSNGIKSLLQLEKKEIKDGARERFLWNLTPGRQIEIVNVFRLVSFDNHSLIYLPC